MYNYKVVVVAEFNCPFSSCVLSPNRCLFHAIFDSERYKVRIWLFVCNGRVPELASTSGNFYREAQRPKSVLVDVRILPGLI